MYINEWLEKKGWPQLKERAQGKQLALIEVGEEDVGARLFGKGLVKDAERLETAVHWYLFNEEIDDV